jgi:hypothetical protein
MTRVLHQVYSPDLSLCDFWLFGYAKEHMTDQTITSEDDLESAATEVWEKVNIDLFQ